MEGELTEGKGPLEPGKERKQGVAANSLPTPNHGGYCSTTRHIPKRKSILRHKHNRGDKDVLQTAGVHWSEHFPVLVCPWLVCLVWFSVYRVCPAHVWSRGSAVDLVRCLPAAGCTSVFYYYCLFDFFSGLTFFTPVYLVFIYPPSYFWV